MRIRLVALVPLLVAFLAWLSSPSTLALLPDNISHIIMIGAAIAQSLVPALITDKPSTKV